MRRACVLSVLVVCGVTLAALQAPQGPTAAALSATRIEKVKDNLYVITGSDFSRDFVAWGQAQMKAGKSADEAAAASQVPAKYKGYTTSVGGFGGPMPNTQALYDEFKNAGRQP
jgi:hypothetical protein